MRDAALAAGEPRRTHAPEQALLAAVLERACDDLRMFAQVPSAAAQLEVRRLRAWFASDYCGADAGGYSFAFICQHLEVDPERMRELVPVRCAPRDSFRRSLALS